MPSSMAGSQVLSWLHVGDLHITAADWMPMTAVRSDTALWQALGVATGGDTQLGPNRNGRKW